jgi:hypothetical protein
MSVLMIPVLMLAIAAGSDATPRQQCSYDKAAMLALDEDAFDQDLGNGGGGWRSLEGKPGCEQAMAELLAAYRKAHPDGSTMLAWHEGQVRAGLGQDAQAIALFDAARKPAEQDLAGWNRYVDASIAFLQHDRPALQAARDALSRVPYPGGEGMPTLKDGYLEIAAESGRPAMRVRWPPNIDVVDGFLHCFDKPYKEAYRSACRPHAAVEVEARPAPTKK